MATFAQLMVNLYHFFSTYELSPLQLFFYGLKSILSAFQNGLRTNGNLTIGQETKNYTGPQFARPLALLFAGREPQASRGNKNIFRTQFFFFELATMLVLCYPSWLLFPVLKLL